MIRCLLIRLKSRLAKGGLSRFFFHPVAGHFRILTFRGSHDILSADQPRTYTGHYVIVLKVDDNQRILDGYFYLMEWGRRPLGLPDALSREKPSSCRDNDAFALGFFVRSRVMTLPQDQKLISFRPRTWNALKFGFQRTIPV